MFIILKVFQISGIIIVLDAHILHSLFSARMKV